MTDPKDFHPAVAGVLRFFEYGHLPEGPIREASREFHDFAHRLAQRYGTMANSVGPEITYALRELLKAKDCGVRCAVLTEQARRGTKVIPNPSEFLTPPESAPKAGEPFPQGMAPIDPDNPHWPSSEH